MQRLSMLKQMPEFYYIRKLVRRRKIDQMVGTRHGGPYLKKAGVSRKLFHDSMLQNSQVHSWFDQTFMIVERVARNMSNN